MNRIEEMTKATPIVYKALKDVGFFYNGVTGKSKKDFEDGNAKFISYMNVFSHLEIQLDVDDKIKIAKGEKQNTISYGDIIFTTSSETPNECGMSSVMTEHTDEKLYLNSFCFGYRFNDLTNIYPSFYKHYFRSTIARKQIAKTANGVTRFNVSKKLFGEIQIPLPPLPIQQEIVNILDKFTSLQQNLEDELKLRQKQYEYYREKLLTFEEGECEWKKISEIGVLVRGNGLQKKDFTEEGTGCIHYGQIYTKLGFSISETLTFVDSDIAEKFTQVEPGNLVIACTSENVDDVCKSVVWLGDKNIVTGGHACVFKHNENPSYIGYCFLTNSFYKQKIKYVYGAKVIDIKTEKLGEIQLPIPSLERQSQIVQTLDHFEFLISNIKTEIELRKKQYEYYREQLLTF